MRKVDKSRDGHINTRNINMAANAALLAVRNGPLARAGLINTGPAANRETTRFTNVHGITGIESFAQLKPDQLGAVIKAYNNGLPACHNVAARHGETEWHRWNHMDGNGPHSQGTNNHY